MTRIYDRQIDVDMIETKMLKSRKNCGRKLCFSIKLLIESIYVVYGWVDKQEKMATVKVENATFCFLFCLIAREINHEKTSKKSTHFYLFFLLNEMRLEWRKV